MKNTEIMKTISIEDLNVNGTKYSRMDKVKFVEESLSKFEMIWLYSKIKYFDPNINKHNIRPTAKTFDGKVTSVQLDGLVAVCQCPKNQSKVDIEEQMTIYDLCPTVLADD